MSEVYISTDSLPLHIDTISDVMTSVCAPKNVTVLYACDYCGTEYNADTGFVPPCQNCGARLRRVG